MLPKYRHQSEVCHYFSYGVASMPDKRDEDRYSVLKCDGNFESLTGFGIFDGHGGGVAADICAKTYCEKVLNYADGLMKKYETKRNDLETDFPGIDVYDVIMCDSINKASKSLVRKIKRLSSMGGSTATVLFIKNCTDGTKRVHCANVGNSRCAVQRNSKILLLSEDHTLQLKREFDRIQEKRLPQQLAHSVDVATLRHVVAHFSMLNWYQDTDKLRSTQEFMRRIRYSGYAADKHIFQDPGATITTANFTEKDNEASSLDCDYTISQHLSKIEPNGEPPKTKTTHRLEVQEISVCSIEGDSTSLITQNSAPVLTLQQLAESLVKKVHRAIKATRTNFFLVQQDGIFHPGHSSSCCSLIFSICKELDLDVTSAVEEDVLRQCVLSAIMTHARLHRQQPQDVSRSIIKLSDILAQADMSQAPAPDYAELCLRDSSLQLSYNNDREFLDSFGDTGQIGIALYCIGFPVIDPRSNAVMGVVLVNCQLDVAQRSLQMLNSLCNHAGAAYAASQQGEQAMLPRISESLRDSSLPRPRASSSQGLAPPSLEAVAKVTAAAIPTAISRRVPVSGAVSIPTAVTASLGSTGDNLPSADEGGILGAGPVQSDGKFNKGGNATAVGGIEEAETGKEDCEDDHSIGDSSKNEQNEPKPIGQQSSVSTITTSSYYRKEQEEVGNTIELMRDESFIVTRPNGRKYIQSRYNILLNLTRSMGDRYGSRRCVGIPDIMSLTLAPADDARLILASDGFWGVISVKEAFSLVNDIANAGDASIFLADQARKRRIVLKHRDDITCMVIDVKGDSSSSSSSSDQADHGANANANVMADPAMRAGACCTIS